jgi:hypothetical protein
MAIWTVFKVDSLFHGDGQRLEQLGRVEAESFTKALETAQRRWPHHVSPRLPQGGLTVTGPYR